MRSAGPRPQTTRPPAPARRDASLLVPPASALGAADTETRQDDIIPYRSDPRPQSGSLRASRTVLRGFGAALVTALAVGAFVPFPRTVTLDGRLVPARTVTLRAQEPGLLTDLLVTAGDTVQPGALVARLRSPTLDEAFRTASPIRPPYALLARRARLDVYAPPFAERRPDGNADPASLWSGGVVLTEGLDERRGTHLDAGDTVLVLAALGSDPRRTVPVVVRAWATEREAQRVRPGMPARVTVSALPHTQPRQMTGHVNRVGLAPDPSLPLDADAQWRVEIAVDERSLRTLLQPSSTDIPSVLQIGFTVRVAVEEHRETLAVTGLRWLRARRRELYSAVPTGSASNASYRNPFSVARTVTDASGPPRS